MTNLRSLFTLSVVAHGEPLVSGLYVLGVVVLCAHLRVLTQSGFKGHPPPSKLIRDLLILPTHKPKLSLHSKKSSLMSHLTHTGLLAVP